MGDTKDASMVSDDWIESNRIELNWIGLGRYISRERGADTVAVVVAVVEVF